MNQYFTDNIFQKKKRLKILNHLQLYLRQTGTLDIDELENW